MGGKKTKTTKWKVDYKSQVFLVFALAYFLTLFIFAKNFCCVQDKTIGESLHIILVLQNDSLFVFQGVQKIMVPGTSVKSSKEALRLTRIYPGIIYSTAGIHPHDSKSIIEEPSSWHEFEQIARAPECVAIGPCGLDYQRDFSEPDVQHQIFEKQILLAKELDKPLLIHERSAQTDVLDLLKKWEL